MSVKVAQVAKRRNEFLKMAMSICKDVDLAEDLTQELYIYLIGIEDREGSLDRIAYKDEVNTYYCYMRLLSSFIQYQRAQSRSIIHLRENYDDLSEALTHDPNTASDAEEEYQKAFNAIADEVEQALEDVHWYDKRMFEEYIKSDKTYRELAQDTKISVTSIFHTVKNVKEYIEASTRPSKKEAWKAAQKRINDKDF